MKNIKLIIVSMLGITFLVSCDSRPIQDIEGVVVNPTYTKTSNQLWMLNV